MGLSMVQDKSQQPRRGTVTHSVLTPCFSSSFVSPHCEDSSLSYHREPFLGTGRGFPQELTVHTSSPCAGTDGQEAPGCSTLLAPLLGMSPAGGLQGGTHHSPGPLTLSCRAACSSFSSCCCFSCDCAMALLCSSESSFRARCSWTILLAISRSCQGKIHPVQKRVSVPSLPKVLPTPHSQELQHTWPSWVLGAHHMQAAPPSPHSPITVPIWIRIQSPRQAWPLGQRSH